MTIHFISHISHEAKSLFSLHGTKQISAFLCHMSLRKTCYLFIARVLLESAAGPASHLNQPRHHLNSDKKAFLLNPYGEFSRIQ
jgi:hypothetical protein